MALFCYMSLPVLQIYTSVSSFFGKVTIAKQTAS